METGADECQRPKSKGGFPSNSRTAYVLYQLMDDCSDGFSVQGSVQPALFWCASGRIV